MKLPDHLIEWLETVHATTGNFLFRMASDTTPGFYRYSWSRDLYPESALWGLGNTVFAAKILYTLYDSNMRDEKSVREMVAFIESFRTVDGYYHDAYLAKKTRWRDWFFDIRFQRFG